MEHPTCIRAILWVIWGLSRGFLLSYSKCLLILLILFSCYASSSPNTALMSLPPTGYVYRYRQVLDSGGNIEISRETRSVPQERSSGVKPRTHSWPARSPIASFHGFQRGRRQGRFPDRSLSSDKDVEENSSTISNKLSRHKFPNIQVLVDIDDTLRSSGGYTLFSIPLGGVDTQYQRGESYPGSFQFILELAANKLRRSVHPLPVAVLTARLPQFSITKDSEINRRLREVGRRRGIPDWGIDTKDKVLYATMREWVFQNTKGDRKFDNFVQLHKMMLGRRSAEKRPPVEYVWVGDTGEMDRKAGELMAQSFPNVVKAVFLHYVTSNYRDNPQPPPDYAVNGVPIMFFRTYVSAARKAAEKGLIEIKGLARVFVEAVLELETTMVPSFSSKWRDLIRDVRAAEHLLQLRDATLPEVVLARNVIQRHYRAIKMRIRRTSIGRSISSTAGVLSRSATIPAPPSSPPTNARLQHSISQIPRPSRDVEIVHKNWEKNFTPDNFRLKNIVENIPLKHKRIENDFTLEKFASEANESKLYKHTPEHQHHIRENVSQRALSSNSRRQMPLHHRVRRSLSS